jgi:hypothetical protein
MPHRSRAPDRRRSGTRRVTVAPPRPQPDISRQRTTAPGLDRVKPPPTGPMRACRESRRCVPHAHGGAGRSPVRPLRPRLSGVYSPRTRLATTAASLARTHPTGVAIHTHDTQKSRGLHHRTRPLTKPTNAKEHDNAQRISRRLSTTLQPSETATVHTPVDTTRPVTSRRPHAPLSIFCELATRAFPYARPRSSGWSRRDRHP